MKLIIAGGGTGGHLFPGMAIAEEWKARGGEVMFVGTPRGLEKNLIPRYGFRLEMIPVSALKGSGFQGKLKTLLGLPKAFLRSFWLLKKEKPDRVLGIGGYASGPMVLVAKLLGMKTAVMDQNAIPGFANRILGKWVDQIFLSFEEASPFFKGKKVQVLGNPVMKKMRVLLEPVSKEGFPKILVCGGSQGAHRLNETFVECVGELQKDFPNLFVYHQTGVLDYEWVQTEMAKRGILGKVAPFFDDMENKYREVHLAIARAGAGTLTELALAGVPSLLIPYPYAADNHQEVNALALEKVKGAEILQEKDLSGKTLEVRIKELLSNPERLKQMSLNVRMLAKPNAAREIVDELLQGKGSPTPTKLNV